MPTDVTVLDDGTLQLVVGGVMFPPLPIEAIETAHDRLGEAQNAANRRTFTVAVRTLTDVLLTQGDTMAAEVTVTSTALTAVVDAATFAAVRARLKLHADADGALTYGPVTITQQADPQPPGP